MCLSLSLSPFLFPALPSPFHARFHTTFTTAPVPKLPIDRVPLSPAELRAAITAAGLPLDRPVRLKVAELTTRQYPPVAKWDPHYVWQRLDRTAAGNQPEVNTDGFFLYDRLTSDAPARWSLRTAPSAWAAPPNVTTMSMMLHQNMDFPGVDPTFPYLSAHVDAANAPELAQDIDMDASEDLKFHVWVGAVGCQTTPHFDYEDNLYINLQGFKRFTLFPPSQQHRFALHPLLHPSWRQAQAFDPNDPGPLLDTQMYGDNVTTTAAAAAAGGDGDDEPYNPMQAQEVTLKFGEALYLPNFWLHWVTAVSGSMAVNVWFDGPDGGRRRAMKPLMKQLGGIPIDKRLPRETAAAAAHAYVHQLLQAVLGDAAATRAFLQRTLNTRYALYRHVLVAQDGAATVDADGVVTGGGGGGDAALSHPASWTSTQFRRRWQQQLADPTSPGFRVLPASHGDLWPVLAAAADASGVRNSGQYKQNVQGRIEFVVAQLAPAMASFPDGIRDIVVGDHLDTVASLVVPLCVPPDRLVRRQWPTLVTDAQPNGATNADGHDVAAWISESLLASA